MLAVPARGRAPDPFDDIAASTWGETVGRAVNSYVEYVHEKARITAKIEIARSKFAASDSAWPELEGLLAGKDMLYLIYTVQFGLDSSAKRLFLERGTVAWVSLGGDIDEGIHPSTRAAFLRVVEDMRAELKKMGCMVSKGRGGSEDLIFLPGQFSEALKKITMQWSAYKWARKAEEYRRAGKQMSELNDPRRFVILMLTSRRELSPDEATEEYQALLAAIGQEQMVQAATAAAQVPQNEDGSLEVVAIARLGLVLDADLPNDQRGLPTGKTADGKTVVRHRSPYAVLKALWCRDNPRAFGLFAMAAAWDVSYATAWRRMQLIAAAVGHQRLESALAEFYGSRDKGFWEFQAALLAGDDTKAQIRYFIAIDPDTSDAAAVDKRYQELARLKGESELLKTAATLRSGGWKALFPTVYTNRGILILGKRLGLKGAPNPHYFQWAGCGPGTTATYDVDQHMVRMHYQSFHSKREVRVAAVTADFVELSITESTQEQDGGWKELPARSQRIDAHQDLEKGPAGAIAIWPLVPGRGWLEDPVGSEIKQQGIATIFVDGKVIDCTRTVWRGSPVPVEVQRHGGRSRWSEAEDFLLKAKDVAKVWTNPGVPGWVVKTMRTVPGRETVIRMIAFELKPAGASAAKAATSAKSYDWMRSTTDLAGATSDAEQFQNLDPGSRAWLNAAVGTSVTHVFHYEGPDQRGSNVQEKVDARVVSRLVERDEELSFIRSAWQDGGKIIQRASAEVGPAHAKVDYVGQMIAWIGSNRRTPGRVNLSKQRPFPASVTIDGRRVDCLAYGHIPLPNRAQIEQLILSESVPGAIVHLSVRSDPGTQRPLALTYSLEGLDAATLPTVPKLKPKGGSFAVEQELLIDKRGKWVKGKILRFIQLPHDGGGRYLIQVGRYPTWYNEDWLREHSRPVPADAAALKARLSR